MVRKRHNKIDYGLYFVIILFLLGLYGLVVFFHNNLPKLISYYKGEIDCTLGGLGHKGLYCEGDELYDYYNTDIIPKAVYMRLRDPLFDIVLIALSGFFIVSYFKAKRHKTIPP